MSAQRLTRTLAEVAREIGDDWHAMRRPYTVTPRGMRPGHPAHLPYMVMRTMRTDDLSADDHAGSDAVRQFLAASSGWRGTTATRVKAELRDALAHHDIEHHEPTDLPEPTPLRRAYSARLDSRRGRTGTYDPMTNPRGFR